MAAIGQATARVNDGQDKENEVHQRLKLMNLKTPL
jgi:hypothetical protein